ncbi:response regulator [Bosea sp. OAE506]|uniref:response regulator n=1 Tax=Bosea sp. OAE506 TaxID=2663870 RepID=UPI00178A922F
MTDRILTGLRMLVVEDEMMLLMMIESMLEEIGCQSISVAATVKQALLLIETETFDLAMLDLNLNGDRSYPVADALAEQAVPFMFSTGYSADGMLEPYRNSLILKKPYSFEALAGALEKLIGNDRRVPEAV